MKIVLAHEVKQLIMNYAFFERGHIAVVTEGMNQADVLGITKDKLAVEFEVKVSKSDLNKELAAIRYAIMTMKEGKNLAPITLGAEQEQLNLEFASLKQKAGGWSKISKHEEYIDPKAYFESHKRYMLTNSYVPNYYYIVVPRNLVEYAVEKLQGTGYGVISYNGCRSQGDHYGYLLEGEWVGSPERGAAWAKGKPCSFDSSGCRLEPTVKQRARRIHSDPVSDNILMAILHRACTENIFMLRELVELKQSVPDNDAEEIE